MLELISAMVECVRSPESEYNTLAISQQNINFKEVTEKFNRYIKEAEVFILQDECIGKYLDYEDRNISSIEAPPFKSCYFQIAENISLGMIGEEFQIASALIYEIAPNNFDVFLLTISTEDGHFRVHFSNTEKEKMHGSKGFHFLDSAIKAIHNGKEGVEKVKKYLKIGRGKNKENHKINRIIHIREKKTSEDKIKSVSGRSIDWSHSWLVRGHWRRIDGIGKNRLGEYVIEGKTFVSPHQKGKGDLIKKVRMV